MPRKTLFMGTTEVPAEQSAGSITSMLVQAGATRVSMKYAERKIVGIEFYFQQGALEFPFEIPAKASAIFDKLWAARSPQYRMSKDRVNVMAQAERIAWRQLFRWVEAIMKQRFKALPAPEKPL